MKTTLDIADPLLDEARTVAAHDRTTLRALVEQGLRQILNERRKQKSFKLRDASVSGQGLSPEFADGDWSKIRDLIYDGRGTVYREPQS